MDAVHSVFGSTESVFLYINNVKASKIKLDLISFMQKRIRPFHNRFGDFCDIILANYKF